LTLSAGGFSAVVLARVFRFARASGSPRRPRGFNFHFRVHLCNFFPGSSSFFESEARSNGTRRGRRGRRKRASGTLGTAILLFVTPVADGGCRSRRKRRQRNGRRYVLFGFTILGEAAGQTRQRYPFLLSFRRRGFSFSFLFRI
jgi:hypothetical protein